MSDEGREDPVTADTSATDSEAPDASDREVSAVRDGETPATSDEAPVQEASAQEAAAPEVAADARSSAVTREPASGTIRTRFAGRTAVGLVREHNEDNFIIADLSENEAKPRDQTERASIEEEGFLFAVCDGMGGAAAGEVASKMGVDLLLETLRREGAPANRDALARRLVSAVEEAGARIFDAAQKERSRRGMGTTATAAVLVDRVLFLAEVGDSRAYMLRGGELKLLTKDQSLVNQLIEAGHLTEEEADAFEHQNIILQALGTSEHVQVDLTFVELRAGDRVMLCSDGLSGLVHHDAMRDTLKDVADPNECCARLVEQAEAGGGHDNITVIVADFEGDALPTPSEHDSFGYMQYPLPPDDDDTGAFTDEETTAAGQLPAKAPTIPPVPRAIEAIDRTPAAVWLVGGGALLAAAVAVWFVASPPERPAAPVDAERVEVPLPEPIPEPPAVMGRVKVHTDVEGATLFVNGDERGALSSTDSRTLDLEPGAYRLEARNAGTLIASVTVTLRDEPMEVWLEMPRGEDENAAGAEAEEPAAPEPPEQPEAAPPEPEPEPEPAAAPPPSAVAAKPSPAPSAPAVAPIAPAATKPAAAPSAPVAAPTAPVPTPPAAAPSTPAPAPRPAPPSQGAPVPAPAPTPVPQAPPTDIPDNPF